MGIEGVIGSNALFGINYAMLESIVQVPGTALPISRSIGSRAVMWDQEPTTAAFEAHARWHGTPMGVRAASRGSTGATIVMPDGLTGAITNGLPPSYHYAAHGRGGATDVA